MQMRPTRPGATLCALTLTLTGLLAFSGCEGRGIEVQQSTPEEAARSLGRILCLEHQQRIDAIIAQLDETRELQEARAELISDAASVSRVNERLEAFADFISDNDDALRACEVVLVDLEVVEPDTRVHLAFKTRFGDWESDGAQALSLVKGEETYLLTLNRIDEAWRVVESSHDLSLPSGALRSLLD